MVPAFQKTLRLNLDPAQFVMNSKRIPQFSFIGIVFLLILELACCGRRYRFGNDKGINFEMGDKVITNNCTRSYAVTVFGSHVKSFCAVGRKIK